MAGRGDSLIMDGRPVRVLACRAAPAKLGVDLVLAYTGAFRREEDLRKHLAAGARFVSLPAPARAETVATVVHGVNQAPTGQQMISCPSCTTNRIAPVAEVMSRRIGVRQAIMTAVHAHTPSQQLIDGPAEDFRRGRAGARWSGRYCRSSACPFPSSRGRGDDAPGRYRVPGRGGACGRRAGNLQCRRRRMIHVGSAGTHARHEPLQSGRLTAAEGARRPVRSRDSEERNWS